MVTLSASAGAGTGSPASRSRAISLIFMGTELTVTTGSGISSHVARDLRANSVNGTFTRK
jgi:hypothetical protein